MQVFINSIFPKSYMCPATRKNLYHAFNRGIALCSLFIYYFHYLRYTIYFVYPICTICIALVSGILDKDQDSILFIFCVCNKQNITHQRLL